MIYTDMYYIHDIYHVYNTWYIRTSLYMDCSWTVTLKMPTSQPTTNLNWVNLINFIATNLIFWDMRPYIFNVLIYVNKFPESHDFVAKLEQLDRDKLEHVSLIQHVTGIATKPWLSGNMLPNIKTDENGWSNFWENLLVVAIKLIELSQFA